ncbi:ubiquitin-specific protease [Trifolium repens]|nr:ubiquitin-specific protease [Trifolium repens]
MMSCPTLNNHDTANSCGNYLPKVSNGRGLFGHQACYLGWQCRRVRTIQNDINELKKQVKPVPITPDVNSVESSPPSPLELQIQQLTEVYSSNAEMDSESDEHLIYWSLVCKSSACPEKVSKDEGRAFPKTKKRKIKDSVNAQPETTNIVHSQPVKDPSPFRFTWKIDRFSQMKSKKLNSDVFEV